MKSMRNVKQDDSFHAGARHDGDDDQSDGDGDGDDDDNDDEIKRSHYLQGLGTASIILHLVGHSLLAARLRS